jgi:hypothetical protein
VILMCRRSPARRGLGANAPQVLQRTAELIPDQLKFSASFTLHPCGVTHRNPARGTKKYPASSSGPRATRLNLSTASNAGTPCEGALSSVEGYQVPLGGAVSAGNRSALMPRNLRAAVGELRGLVACSPGSSELLALAPADLP